MQQCDEQALHVAKGVRRPMELEEVEITIVCVVRVAAQPRARGGRAPDDGRTQPAEDGA